MKESRGSGVPEERLRENGDALPREGSLGPLPGPAAQPHKGEGYRALTSPHSLGGLGCSWTAPPHAQLLRAPPSPHPTGILKKKCPPAAVGEKSSLLRLPLEQATASSRGSSASDGSRAAPPPRPPPRQSLQEQLNGVMPIAMSIKAGTVDEDSSGSE